MNDHLKLLKETVSYGVEVYFLVISKLTDDQIKLIYLPKLERIDFERKDHEIVIGLNDQAFEKEFKIWICNLYDLLSKCKNIDNLIYEFGKAMKKHMLLFLKEKKPSIEKVRGLFGELLELKRTLEIENINKQDVLNGWNRPSPANHDFDYNNYSLEVKAIGRSKTRVKISSENQLNKYNGKELILKVSVVDSVNNSSSDSLGELYEKIRSILDINLSIHFENRCSSDAFFEYFGPENTPLDIKLFELESSFFVIDQEDFPRLHSKNIPNGISNVEYEIDLSSMESFKTEKTPCPQN